MAITGSGTQADPWVVHDWDEFLSVKENGSGNYIRFTDINIDENGDFDISGTGTSADPFIVSTYREMLYCTGAPNIHQCKMIAKDDTTREMTYRYDYENPETHAVTSKYCRYNPAPSTIDFNDIYESYIATIEISNHVDVNGWTWLNLRVAGMYGIFRCGTYYTDQTSMNHLILLNCQVTAANGINFLFCGAINDSIMQVDVTKSDDGVLYWFGSGDSSYASTRYFYRCSLKLKVVAPHATVYGGAWSGDAMYSEDCIFDFDITANAVTSGTYGFRGARAIVKGKINAVTVGNYFDALTDSIYDITDAGGTPINRPVSSARCVYNKDKVNWSDTTGLTGVTSAQLLSPTALQAAGLSIGVDT